MTIQLGFNMLTEKRIKEIISDLAGKGFTIKVRDIAFLILSKSMPEDLAYRAIFMDNNFKTYQSMSHVIALKSHWKYNVEAELTSAGNEETSIDSITSSGNRAAMEKLIRDLTRDIEDGIYTEDRDRITAQKTVADLRIKLADKFGVQEDNVEQVVIIEPKFNSICSCGREIHIPTKEEMMTKYNLIENPKKK